MDEADTLGAVFQVLGADGRPVGAGFLVGIDTAFTCAHVVQAAGQATGGRVEITFPGLPRRPRVWGQVLTEGWREPEEQDVAVLRLTGLPQGAGALPVGVAAGCRGHRVFSFGFPAQALDGGHFGYGTAADLLGRQGEAGPLLQLAGANSLTSGFSGAPVVDEMTGLVVGMVTAVVSPDTHLKGLDIAYATPAEVLREVWPQLAERQVCPYRGLEPFGTEHAQWFHGRERAVEKVLAAFAGNRRLLMLLGPSGAGKSSLVNAGVLPALADGAVTGSDRWLTLVTRPGRDLLAQLEESGLPGAADGGLAGAAEARLAAEPERDRLLLVIDQFEELLTQPAPEAREDDGHGGDVRIRAVQELTALAASAVPVTLLLITRNDFYAPLSELAPDLIDAASPSMCNIPGTLGRPELEAIVTRPAQTVGLPWETGLADRIVNDVLEADPTTRQAPAVLLPALELALRQLWVRRRREDGRLTHTAYEKIGGVTGSMTAWCNQALGQLPPDHRTTAQRVLTALVRPADPKHGTPATRQLVPLTQLRGLAADPQPTGTNADSAFDAVLAALTGHRIITTNTTAHPDPDPGRQVPGEATAELIHDTLLRDWTDLRDWVTQDHQFQVWLQRAREQQALHARSGLPDDLLKGSLLAEGNEWAAHRALTPQITQLLHDSRQQQHKALRRTRRLNTILGTLLALALVATGIAFYQQHTATTAQRAATAAQRTAQSRQLAALSATFAESDPDLSSLLAVKAWKTSPTAEAAAALSAAPAAPLMHSCKAEGAVLAFSRDGKEFATGNYNGTARVWDVESGKLLATFTGVDGALPSVAFSPDGNRLATGGHDGTAQVWDIKSGKSLVAFSGGTIRTGPLDGVVSLAFSPDGRRLAVGSNHGLRVWDVESGQNLTTEYTDDVLSVAFSPDGKRIATAGSVGIVQMWDVKSGAALTRLKGHTSPVMSVAFSPDGKRLATGSEDYTVRVWDVKAGKSLTTLEGRTSSVLSVAFSPDGKRLATGSEDGTAQVWDVKFEQSLATLKGHTEARAVWFSPDGARLATGSEDGTAQVWDVKSEQSLATLKGSTDMALSVAFSPDGKRLATDTDDGSVQMLDLKSRKRLATFNDHTTWVSSVVFSPDGKRLVTGTGDGIVQVWDVQSRQRLASLKGHTQEVLSVAFSPDGARLATGSEDGTAQVWDMKTEKRLAAFKHRDARGVLAVAFSPDGNRLVAGSSDGIAQTWDVRSRKRLATFNSHTGSVFSMAFSSGGKKIATDRDSTIAQVWDMKSGESLATFKDNTDSVSSVAFSPNGKRVAVGSHDGTVQVWDVESGASLATRIGHTDSVWSVAFSADGKRLATGSEGTVQVWDVNIRDATAISRSICMVLRRDFTKDEQGQYLQGQDPTPVCRN
ncbi:trypsin-like peptidase domain-containing protein [Streptomyces sp. G5(2025)]|uniref:nSTAND1 domain-containing NTPase n=1 Tax=Streptomyces sp. G5(2025) TaxID=3406628 RepID=UPI003C1749D4